MNAGANAVTEKLQEFLVRIENKRVEIKELKEQEKEIFSEAKVQGFDTKLMQEILKLRRMDLDDFDEYDKLRTLYLLAAGLKRTVVVDAEENPDPPGKTY